jgi:uncharacterized Fe-S cluster-containing protein
MATKGETRPYRLRREYLLKAVQRRRKKIRQMAIDYKGGRCSRCGYDRCAEALEFHHAEASGKEFGISAKGYTRSWEKTKQELDKCILLCANCHREVQKERGAGDNEKCKENSSA